MTEEQRRYMHARQRVETFLVNPIKELLEAAAALTAAEKSRADTAEGLLEELRPVWAQGFTSDSEAAQANGNALAELWRELGVENQTDAMAALRAILGDA